MTAWDLDELSGGRFIVGLGSQVKRVNEERFSVVFEHPAPKLKEYAQVMRTVWAANRGEDVTFEGRFYRVTMPSFHGTPQPDRRDIPIYFAAVGEVMARTCGEVADGLLAHPLASTRYLAEVVRPAVDEGAEKAGRKPSECNITASALVSISDDVDLGREGGQATDRVLRDHPHLRGHPPTSRPRPLDPGAPQRLRREGQGTDDRAHRR